jgi:hypothetical protein
MPKHSREDLEKKAKELGLSFVPESSDSDLEKLIKDFESEDKDPTKKQYYKTATAGLAVSLSDSDERGSVGVDEVRFTPYELWDEKKGDHYRLGLLETDEPEAIEILDEDSSVTNITQTEYKNLIKDGKKIAY